MRFKKLTTAVEIMWNPMLYNAEGFSFNAEKLRTNFCCENPFWIAAFRTWHQIDRVDVSVAGRTTTTNNILSHPHQTSITRSCIGSRLHNVPQIKSKTYLFHRQKTLNKMSQTSPRLWHVHKECYSVSCCARKSHVIMVYFGLNLKMLK